MAIEKSRKHRARRHETTNRENLQTGSPAQSGNTDLVSGWGMPVIAGAIVFFIYLRTLAPAMTFGDGPELAAAASVLGTPHPTGYPLFMLLLKVVSFASFGETITRTSLASAAAMACATGISAAILRDLMRAALPAAAGWSHKTILIASACGAIAGGLLFFHWDNAVVTEVYALEFLLMIAFARATQQCAESPRPACLVASALCLGLGLAHHRLSLAMIPPLAIMWWSVCHRSAFKTLRGALAWSIVAVTAGLSLYLYLPLRAAASPAINWGNPRSWPAFIDHVRGGEFIQYRLLRPAPNRGFTPASYGQFVMRQCGQITGDFARQIAPFAETQRWDDNFGRGFSVPPPEGAAVFLFMAAFAVYGVVVACRKAGRFIFLLALMAAFNLAVIFAYNIADIRDYYLFPFWLGWIMVFVGFLALAGKLAEKYGLPRRFARPECAYALVFVPILVISANFRRCDRSRDFAAEDCSSIILPKSEEIMPPGSILITGGDWDTFTSWYRQIVRGDRRDVLIVASNFLSKPWYASFFTPDQIKDHGLRFYEGTPFTAEDLVSRIRESVIEPNIDKKPVFTSSADPLVLRLLNDHYQLKPAAAAPVSFPADSAGDTTVTLIRIGRK
ncbi:MAG: DUF2723 domain-containing protein [Candidatus Sumerlaeota bacterium]|nr:DUF2723 domain-containing protein [Candidatus Sumerlaeota bacterium]